MRRTARRGDVLSHGHLNGAVLSREAEHYARGAVLERGAITTRRVVAGGEGLSSNLVHAGVYEQWQSWAPGSGSPALPDGAYWGRVVPSSFGTSQCDMVWEDSPLVRVWLGYPRDAVHWRWSGNEPNCWAFALASPLAEYCGMLVTPW